MKCRDIVRNPWMWKIVLLGDNRKSRPVIYVVAELARNYVHCFRIKNYLFNVPCEQFTARSGCPISVTNLLKFHKLIKVLKEKIKQVKKLNKNSFGWSFLLSSLLSKFGSNFLSHLWSVSMQGLFIQT